MLKQESKKGASMKTGGQKNSGGWAAGTLHSKVNGKHHPRMNIKTGWWFQPLWKIWVSQLGWWHSQYTEKNPNHQPIIFPIEMSTNLSILTIFRHTPSWRDQVWPEIACEWTWGSRIVMGVATRQTRLFHEQRPLDWETMSHKICQMH